MTSARPATSSSKTLALSWWIVTVARLKLAWAKASLAEPGLAMTRTPGWSIAAIKVKRLPNEPPRIAPEFDSCREIALQTGLPLPEVYRIVAREAEAWLEQRRTEIPDV